jgi:hypothetical protein
VHKNDDYYIFHNQSVEADYSFKNHLKMAWLVVKYNHDKFPPHDENVYYVQKGDIIKFGRVRFKIRELKLNRSTDSASSEEAITHDVRMCLDFRHSLLQDTIAFDGQNEHEMISSPI